MVGMGGLDMLFACEMGGALLGLEAAGIDLTRVLRERSTLGPQVCLHIGQNFVVVWSFNKATRQVEMTGNSLHVIKGPSSSSAQLSIVRFKAISQPDFTKGIIC